VVRQFLGNRPPPAQALLDRAHRPDSQRRRKGTIRPPANSIKPSLAAARSVRLGSRAASVSDKAVPGQASVLRPRMRHRMRGQGGGDAVPMRPRCPTGTPMLLQGAVQSRDLSRRLRLISGSAEQRRERDPRTPAGDESAQNPPNRNHHLAPRLRWSRHSPWSSSPRRDDDPMGGARSCPCPMSNTGCEAQRRPTAVLVRRLSPIKKRGRTAGLPRFPMKCCGPPSAGLSRYGASAAVLRRWARTDALRTGSLATSLAADMIAMTSTPE
jgi:hypothetical protein